MASDVVATDFIAYPRAALDGYFLTGCQIAECCELQGFGNCIKPDQGPLDGDDGLTDAVDRDAGTRDKTLEQSFRQFYIVSEKVWLSRDVGYGEGPASDSRIHYSLIVPSSRGSRKLRG